MRADTSASVRPASESELLLDDPAGVFGTVSCARGVAVATRVAAAAAPRTDTVNSRRDRGGIGGNDTPVLRQDLGFGICTVARGSRFGHLHGGLHGIRTIGESQS